VPVVNRYDMYCPIARALDVLGDRWTLLILRELTMGERRFTDLKRFLRGIPPNVLSARLKALTEEGLVTTRELPPPAARTVYTVTDRGREVTPVLRALVRFGMPALEPAGPDVEVRPIAVMRAGMLPYFDRTAAAAVGPDERYRLVVDGEEHWLSSAIGELASGSEPADLVLDGPAWVFMAVRQGTTTLADAIVDGTVTKTGSARALRNFERVFSLA
jgi:DNA-binding HxlR family transcriptional regulator